MSPGVRMDQSPTAHPCRTSNFVVSLWCPFVKEYDLHFGGQPGFPDTPTPTPRSTVGTPVIGTTTRPGRGCDPPASPRLPRRSRDHTLVSRQTPGLPDGVLVSNKRGSWSQNDESRGTGSPDGLSRPNDLRVWRSVSQHPPDTHLVHTFDPDDPFTFRSGPKETGTHSRPVRERHHPRGRVRLPGRERGRRSLSLMGGPLYKDLSLHLGLLGPRLPHDRP